MGWFPLLAGLSLAALAGCAHVQVDADGTRHVTGLVSLRIAPAGAGGKGAGSMFRIASLGVLLLRTETEGSLGLGYQTYSAAMLGADSCASLSALRGEGR